MIRESQAQMILENNTEANIDKLMSYITQERLEWAYGKAIEFQRRNDKEHLAQYAMNAARKKERILLQSLERGTNILLKMQEKQQGETMRQSTRNYSERVDLTEYSLWREAYISVDKGQPLENFKWIYLAAAFACGGLSVSS